MGFGFVALADGDGHRDAQATLTAEARGPVLTAGPMSLGATQVSASTGALAALAEALYALLNEAWATNANGVLIRADSDEAAHVLAGACAVGWGGVRVEATAHSPVQSRSAVCVVSGPETNLMMKRATPLSSVYAMADSVSSVGGWLAVETALRLAPLGKRAAAVFALDGPEPSQFDLDCSYAPAEAAAELLLGRNRTFPEGWAAMTADQRVDAFLALLPSLGIHFLGYDAAKGDVENREIVSHELTAGAAAFIDTLRTPGVYDKATSKLDADLVLFRASERRAVKMLKDGDADAAPHLYAWASAGVPNVTVVDCPSNHMHMLLDKPKIDAIRATVLDFVDMSNRK